jgi:UDP-N-acetylmuramyl pentapeptide phosphotransferase/UDP-N-acetylglucosamine-1-phosphate transferase
VAILLSILLGHLLLFALDPLLFTNQYKIMIILSAGVVIAVMGLVDDINHLSSTLRLVIQGICAILCAYGGLYLDTISIPGFGVVALGPWGIGLSIFWVVAFTNTYNFLDGLNGLASGSTLISLLFLAWMAWNAQAQLATYSFLISFFGILGFFVFNFPKGKIFMGDVGSQFIGFLLAEFALLAKEPVHGQLSFYVIPLLFFNAIYDIGFTLARRYWRGEKVTQAHREHLFQLLSRTGWSHTRISILHFFFVELQGIGALQLQSMATEHQWLMFIPYLGVQILYSVWVLKRARRAHLLP